MRPFCALCVFKQCLCRWDFFLRKKERRSPLRFKYLPSKRPIHASMRRNKAEQVEFLGQVSTRKHTHPLWSWWSPGWGRWRAGGTPCRWVWTSRGTRHPPQSGCSESLWHLLRIPRHTLGTHGEITLKTSCQKTDGTFPINYLSNLCNSFGFVKGAILCNQVWAWFAISSHVTKIVIVRSVYQLVQSTG